MIHHIQYINKLTADYIALLSKVKELEAENKKLQDTVQDYDFAFSAVYTPPEEEEDIIEDITEDITEEDIVANVLTETVNHVVTIDEQKAKENAVLNKLVTKRRGTPYRDSSKKTFRHNLYHLSEHVFGKPKMFELQDFVEHSDKVIDYLITYNGKSGKTYCRNLIDIFRCNDIDCDKYNDFRDTFVKGYTQCQRPKGWDWSRVVEKYEELGNMEDKNYAQHKLYVILALYNELVPHRQEIYLNMGWEDKGDNNYLDLDKGVMFLRYYKTSDVYGDRQYKINNDLMKILVDWKNTPLAYKGIDNYLFTTKKGTPPMTNTFTNFMYQHIGITTNQMRKLYVSDIVMLMTNDEKTEIAQKMLHSSSMQALTYSQYREPKIQELQK
jgi:hypothetical protein